MSDLRTAAIEAGLASPWAFHSNPELVVGAIVDAILPLLVAGTSSRIADAIEAKADRVQGHSAVMDGRRGGLYHAAAIARRVGETS